VKTEITYNGWLRKICFIGKMTGGVILFPALLSVAQPASAQKVIGHVFTKNNEGEKQPLPGVNLYFSGNSKNRVITDTNGSFSILRKKADNTSLIATSIGFASDSLIIADNDSVTEVEFILQNGVRLSEFVVNGKKNDATVSRLSVPQIEIINSDGLMKMACCNLSQSFENSATATVGYADAVSGARQIQLLGLSGIYGQMLAENTPTLRGLSAPYGWNHIPGSWLESIQISKGTSSVVNGYEAITGQINLEFKKPDKVEDLYADVYASSIHMYEANVTGSRKLTDKLWANLLVHGSIANHVHDGNNDHFMDMPRNNQFTVFNRWLYADPAKKLESRTGISFLYENRLGGQSPLCHKADIYYTTDVVNQNFNIYNKTGIFTGKKGQSIAWINKFTTHDLYAYFGSDMTYKLYNGRQNSFYSNLIFSSWIGNRNNQYITGISFQSDNYKTCFKDKLPENNIPLTNLNKKELVPGAYFQYTWTPIKRFTWIAGAREDYNSFAGWLFTPRSNIRYAVTDNLIFRLSGGRGFHTPNAITDNIGLMASTRNFNIDGIKKLKIEKAWNYGGNVTAYIPLPNSKKVTLSFDYFHTDFEDQAIADLDRSRTSVWFYNTNGSFANVLQTDLSFSPFTGFDVYAAFRYNQTMVTYTDGIEQFKSEKPLSPKYRGLVNLAYATKFRKWVFDFTSQINGPVRIPSLNGYSGFENYSQAFPQLFAQITRNMKRIDIYFGAENISNFKQSNPILNAENPFAKGFDASQVWGPLVGTSVYGGLRLRLGRI